MHTDRDEAGRGAETREQARVDDIKNQRIDFRISTNRVSVSVFAGDLITCL